MYCNSTMIQPVYTVDTDINISVTETCLIKFITCIIIIPNAAQLIMKYINYIAK